MAHRVAAGSPQPALCRLKRAAEMKAVVDRRYGGPEVLEYTDGPEPKLSHDSVLLRVRAAALNPVDHMLQAGLGEGHTDAWFPVIPGWDVAGVVEQVGAGVTEFAPGDEVIGYIRQEILHHVARGLCGTGQRSGRSAGEETAHGELAGGRGPAAGGSHRLPRNRPETVLIHGATGGVGAVAAQLALAKHARVIGLASAGHHAFLRSSGVLPVAQGDGIASRVRALASDGVDAVLDCVGKGLLHATAELGSSRTRACSIADGGPGMAPGLRTRASRAHRSARYRLGSRLCDRSAQNRERRSAELPRRGTQ